MHLHRVRPHDPGRYRHHGVPAGVVMDMPGTVQAGHQASNQNDSDAQKEFA